jgi:hypothetical protein
MKPIFIRKRVKEGCLIVHEIHVRGFVDGTGNKKASIVISAITGSPSRATGRRSQQLCDRLNKVFEDYYEGR